MPGLKQSNQYADAIPRKVYGQTPKAVFAAIAVAVWVNGEAGFDGEKIGAEILNEWRILYENGIVPQKPPANLIPLLKEVR